MCLKFMNASKNIFCISKKIKLSLNYFRIQKLETCKFRRYIKTPVGFYFLLFIKTQTQKWITFEIKFFFILFILLLFFFWSTLNINWIRYSSSATLQNDAVKSSVDLILHNYVYMYDYMCILININNIYYDWYTIKYFNSQKCWKN